MTIRFLAVFLVIFSFSRFASGQITTVPGYVVTTAGDTLKGRLEYVNTNLSANRAFIPEGARDLAFLKPEQVQRLYVNDEIHFRQFTLKKEPVFFQVVSEGALNLYRYKGLLYLKAPADSLILLTGGKQTVTQNGRKYATIDFTYKGQLRKALQTDAYNPQIDRLEFSDEAITRLARDINQKPVITRKPALAHRHQFGLQSGFSRSSLNVKKKHYTENRVHSKTSLEQSDSYFERQGISSVTTGGYYRRKAGRKYAYLKTGFFVESAFETTETETTDLHRSFLITDSGSEPFGLAGYMHDRYRYDFTAIHIPFSYQAELSDGRFRPFLDLGLNTRVFVNRNNTLYRNVYLSEFLVAEKELEIYVKPVSIGPMAGAGGRYLLRNNTALVAGLQFDAVFSRNLVDPNVEKMHAFMFYVAYGF